MSDAVIQGFVLMVTGMGVVFLFLALLVAAMQLSTLLFTRTRLFQSEPPVVALPPRRLAPSSEPDLEIAVALAAVAAHRRRRRG